MLAEAQNTPDGPLQFSVGRVQYEKQNHASVQALLAQADTAMYDDKKRSSYSR